MTSTEEDEDLDETEDDESVDEPNATLIEHREALRGNYLAYTSGLAALRRNLPKMIRRAGYKGLNMRRNEHVQRVDDIFEAIMTTQDGKPFFYTTGVDRLPLVWNSPKNFDDRFIYYEWGHLYTKNDLGRTYDHIQNLCAQSARCNQHIQSGMSIDHVLPWLRGSPMGARAETVMARREELFRGDTLIKRTVVVDGKEVVVTNTWPAVIAFLEKHCRERA